MKFLQMEPVTYYSIEYPNGLYHVRTSPWTVRQEKTTKREQATMTTERSVIINHLYHIHQHEKPASSSHPRLIQWSVTPLSKENELQSGIGSQQGQISFAYVVGKMLSVKGARDTFYYLAPGQLWDQGKYVWKPLMYAYWLSEDEARQWCSYYKQTETSKGKLSRYAVIPIRVEKEVIEIG